MDSQPDGSPRFLVCLSRRVGFFALFFQVLGQLHRSNKEGRIPIVFWGKHCLFWDHEGHYGIRNVWDFFFEPVSKYDITDALPFPLEQLEETSIAEFTEAEVSHSYPDTYPPERTKTLPTPPNVVMTNQWPEFYEPGKEAIREDRRKPFYDLIHEHVRLKPVISNDIDSFYHKHFEGHFVIGVHFRGTEHNDETVSWYQKRYAPEAVYWKKLKQVMASHKEAMVFLATDSELTREWFKQRLGDRLIHCETKLSDPGQAPHYQFGGLDVAKDVLTDCLLLSRCQYLVHGISNVSYAALCFNPTLPHTNVYRSRQLKPSLFQRIKGYLSRTPLYSFLKRLRD